GGTARPSCSDRVLKPEPCTDQALLEPRQQIGGDVAGIGAAREAEAAEETEAPALRLDDAQPHRLAVALAHHAAQIADAVDEAELERAPAGEDLAAEDHTLLGLELGAAARPGAAAPRRSRSSR